MRKISDEKGQFSIIAALLVSIVLVTAIITTYSIIRNSPVRDRPQILGAIDEMNLAINQILDFVVGYYCSILQITGNTTYAKTLTTNYLENSLENTAYTHPHWSPTFEITHSHLSASWFNRTSSSEGTINLTYSLLGLGISGVQYAVSNSLDVTVNPSNTSFVLVNVTRNGDNPYSTLTRDNFSFYNYSYAESTWELANSGLVINSVVSSETDTVYNITVPTGIDPSSYMLQAVDTRGIAVVASTFSHYTYTFSWNQSLYSALSKDTMIIEALQNGSLRWLGQNLQLTSTGKPIPPIPVKAFHINQTINGVNREVPFQIEDWGSNYQVPSGLTNNASVLGNRQMVVFLANHEVENVILWWDGRDIANQTSYAWENRYFNDNPGEGVLSTDDLTLNIGKVTEYLYVNSFSGSYTQWVEIGSSPYLDNSDANYIWDNDNYDRERYFYFEDSSASSGNVESARIQFETRCDGDDYFEFRIFNGYDTYGWYTIYNLPSSYGWKEYDVSSILRSLYRVNNARIEVRYRTSGSGSSDLFIRRCRLLVEVESGFTISSIAGDSTAQAEFLRINNERPVYGADPSYVIYNGSIRDIIQQEAEWSDGVSGCPNLYAQIVLTLPANATYYTYTLRPIFVNSTQSRTITELSAIRLSISNGQPLTENATSGGYPIASNVTGLYFNYSTQTGWAHHWSEFIFGDTGAGIMFTDNANQLLYYFDSMAGENTGALDIISSGQIIEFNPVEMASVSFQDPLDISWTGAVVNFDGIDPIYPNSGTIGLWVMVETPPTVDVSAVS
jgi:hypothetical protein